MNETKNILVTLEHLTVGYLGKNQNSVILENLNLSIAEGELVCLLGPNGCGKSTLIRTIAGMQPSLSGEICIKENAISNLEIQNLAKIVSVVLTDTIDVPNMTVFDIVALGRYPHTGWFGTLHSKDLELINDCISKVGLNHLKTREFLQLSDGEKQRTLIAKALVQDTDFILLDEPTAHLDLSSRIEIMKLLKELAHTTKKSFLLSTHELELALQISDKIWLVSNKEIVSGTASELIQQKAFETSFTNGNFSVEEEEGRIRINYLHST
ncbi:MAG: ABC transporter ATP-binding protein [Bacteroidales bacterium]|nr:ABC transporter ATP-binding protein [Bacteroidales bacterium]